MMKICNFGSLNLDLVYAVDHAVLPGETLSSSGREEFCGGKGLNQSIALAQAGGEVYHAGCIGADGGKLRLLLEEKGVNTRFVRELPMPSGHAVIQVDHRGQNSILLYGGANRAITDEMIDEVLSQFGEGDWLVLQNEINGMPRIMRTAAARGMHIVLNPSPFEEKILTEYPLETVSWFVVNEIEGAALAGTEDPQAIVRNMQERYPGAGILLTLGKRGSLCAVGGQVLEQPIFQVPVKDTTAAGDTFLGFFFALLPQRGPAEALRLATAASALAVSKAGAAGSIPTLAEAEQMAASQAG